MRKQKRKIINSLRQSQNIKININTTKQNRNKKRTNKSQQQIYKNDFSNGFNHPPPNVLNDVLTNQLRNTISQNFKIQNQVADEIAHLKHLEHMKNHFEKQGHDIPENIKLEEENQVEEIELLKSLQLTPDKKLVKSRRNQGKIYRSSMTIKELEELFNNLNPQSEAEQEQRNEINSLRRQTKRDYLEYFDKFLNEN